MRKKTEIRRFTAYCFSRLNLRPIPIHLKNYKALIDPEGECCFGCYVYDDDKPAFESEIFIAHDLPKFSVMSNIAHEIWHYYQNTEGLLTLSHSYEAAEKDAEKGSDCLLADWLRRGKMLDVQNVISLDCYTKQRREEGEHT